MQALEDTPYCKDIFFNLGCYVLTVSANGDIVVCKTRETGGQQLATRQGVPRLGISEIQMEIICYFDLHAPSNGILAFALAAL